MIVACGDREPHDEHEQCPGVPRPGQMLTAAQMVNMMRTVDDDDAVAFMESLMANGEIAHRCLIENHTGAVDDVQVFRRLSGDVAAISDWVDGSYPPDLPEELVTRRRVDKVCEEAGEVVAALSGMYGENPRKGVTHDVVDVVAELLDTAGAALGAVRHLTEADPLRLLAGHMERVWRRAGLAGEDASA